MALEAVLGVFALLDGGLLLFLSVYFIITLSDLECDYINATTCCDRLNKVALPELIAQVVVVLMTLFNLHIVVCTLGIPMAAWLLYKYFTKPSGNIGMYDPAEIHNRNQLKNYMKEAMVKIVYHLLMFFVYLYSMIVSLVGSE